MSEVDASVTLFNLHLHTVGLPVHALIQRGQGIQTPGNQNNKGFLSNTGRDPLKNHKITLLGFNIGLSFAFRWRTGDGPLIVVQQKKRCQS